MKDMFDSSTTENVVHKYLAYTSLKFIHDRLLTVCPAPLDGDRTAEDCDIPNTECISEFYENRRALMYRQSNAHLADYCEWVWPVPSFVSPHPPFPDSSPVLRILNTSLFLFRRQHDRTRSYARGFTTHLRARKWTNFTFEPNSQMAGGEFRPPKPYSSEEVQLTKICVSTIISYMILFSSYWSAPVAPMHSCSAEVCSFYFQISIFELSIFDTF